MIKKLIIPIVFALVASSFVTYSFLDAFIIPKDVKTVSFNFDDEDWWDIDEEEDSSSEPAPISQPSSSSEVSNSNENQDIQESQESESSEESLESQESQDTQESQESQESEESSQSEPESSQPENSSSSNENLATNGYYESLTKEQIASLFTSEKVFREREHYSDPDIYIDITTHRDDEDTTTYYVADIRIKKLSYFRTAFAQDSYGLNVEERTSDICKRNKGILAINGDFYGAQEAGYVLRNGQIFRSTISKSYGNNSRANPEDLAIYRDGTFEIFNERDVTLQEIKDKGAWQVFSFGPGLIKNGEITVTENQEVGTALAGGRNQRTAIGIIAPLHYVFVVNNGRLTNERGFPLIKLAEIMKGLHCVQAYNLDGGGSSTMYLDDGTGNANGLAHLVNKPTQNVYGETGEIGQRTVSDIVYIGK